MSQLKCDIQRYLSIDDELKQLNQQTKQLRDKKRELNKSIINNIEQKHSNIDKLKINVDSRSIKFTNITHYQPITLTYIQECLEKCIDEEENIEYIIDLIKTSRKKQVNKEIKINLL
jgi:predicted transcriptional regulator